MRPDASRIRRHDRESEEEWRRDVLADDDEVMAAGKLSTTSVGRWTWELSPADVAALRGVIGPLLIDLGYAQNLQWRGLRGPSE